MSRESMAEPRTGPAAKAVIPGRRHAALSEMVASYVQELIVTGEVRAGEFLRIEPIAERLGVSNTPVREGLLALRSEGFVRLVPRRGFVVTAFSREDIHDLYWVASRLAGELAARAARVRSEQHLARASASIATMREALSRGDLNAVGRCGHDFHRQINLGAGSGRLAALLGSVAINLPLRQSASIEAQVGDTVDAHARIHDAVARSAASEADALMSEHVMVGALRLISMLEARGVWEPRPGSLR